MCDIPQALVARATKSGGDSGSSGVAGGSGSGPGGATSATQVAERKAATPPEPEATARARDAGAPTPRRAELLKRLAGNSVAWTKGGEWVYTEYYHPSGALPTVYSKDFRDKPKFLAESVRGWNIWRLDANERVEVLWGNGTSPGASYAATIEGTGLTLLPPYKDVTPQLLPGNPKQLVAHTRGDVVRKALAGNSVEWGYRGATWREYFAPDGWVGFENSLGKTRKSKWKIEGDEVQESLESGTVGMVYLVDEDTITRLFDYSKGKIHRGNAFNL